MFSPFSFPCSRRFLWLGMVPNAWGSRFPWWPPEWVASTGSPSRRGVGRRWPWPCPGPQTGQRYLASSLWPPAKKMECFLLLSIQLKLFPILFNTDTLKTCDFALTRYLGVLISFESFWYKISMKSNHLSKITKVTSASKCVWSRELIFLISKTWAECNAVALKKYLKLEPIQQKLDFKLASKITQSTVVLTMRIQLLTLADNKKRNFVASWHNFKWMSEL